MWNSQKKWLLIRFSNYARWKSANTLNILASTYQSIIQHNLKCELNSKCHNMLVIQLIKALLLLATFATFNWTEDRFKRSQVGNEKHRVIQETTLGYIYHIGWLDIVTIRWWNLKGPYGMIQKRNE